MASTLNKRPSTPTVTGSAAKRSKPDYNSIISVLVGEDEEEFKVHKTTHCDRSPYFKAACSTRWQEGREGVVRLPDHKLSTFAIYIHWSYTGELDVKLVGKGESGSPDSHEELVRTWILAHYLGSLDLCNLVIDPDAAAVRG
ncbi:hypothetical protein CLAFUW4_14611 [Fulvia fulva]|uniref:BTB domain-containing protein n=1 Tax=Passalora fulva TaxID=5499 RepID=A0A9Q8PLY2_PASFU|nr:uncharacterized protein CLAFUR5_14440 [Fulvia fulva]KAK4609409.1 hypothetical protein CLAFUR4_14605 [Fulvia fulva]KAK4609856.1 hypothetical protein CLAFUR0_14605 [Fulvia fulva]UJO24868.1 hypothetical protein CLAFUR5_14440 [Fulvia fulva]WPV22933.1 hypothetical protein CLAFUW4_14611 [Fulvia fulva]WPV37409.1 hypothetical protein CLAFUW7_14614 [Fulvia fulva]